MARAWYAGSPADFGVIVSDGKLAPSAITLYLYDAKGGTPQTDLLDADGAVATAITAATDLDVVEWQGPDDYYADLYGTADETPTAESKWYRFGPSITLLEARVAALEAGADPTALDDLTDASTAGAADGYVLTWNSGTGVATFQEPATPNNPEWELITDGSPSSDIEGLIVFRPVA